MFRKFVLLHILVTSLMLILVMSLALLAAGCSRQAPGNTDSKNETSVVDNTQSADPNSDRQDTQDTPGNADNESQTGMQDSGKQNPEDGTGQKAEFSIGGLSPGNPKDEVIRVLGDNYKEEYIDLDVYFGENFYKWTYDKGITVLIGKDSGTVLEIECTTPELETEAGVKVGDTAQSAFDKYGSKYKTPVSRHEDRKLEGWFEAEDGALLIFDMDKDDENLINEEIKPDSKIEMIKLTNIAYMD